MKELIVEIKNKQGIHLLPATLIIKTLREHASRLWIGKSVNRENLTEITINNKKQYVVMGTEKTY